MVAREAVGLLNLLSQVFHIDSKKCRLALLGDNQASISLVGGQSNVRRVRHLSLAQMYLRELCRDDKRVTARWVDGHDNPADMMTKVLQGEIFKTHLTTAGFRP